MRVFFDTSVLVAASQSWHPRHKPSYSLVERARAGTAATASHCLAEFYATVTALPPQYRIAPADCKLILKGFREVLSIVVLNERDYVETVDDVADLRLPSGAVYDALIARCALTWKAEKLYTWNVRDFVRLGREIARITREPS